MRSCHHVFVRRISIHRCVERRCAQRWRPAALFLHQCRQLRGSFGGVVDIHGGSAADLNWLDGHQVWISGKPITAKARPKGENVVDLMED
jgi:hypothetical protein